jgi:hypothetical protein
MTVLPNAPIDSATGLPVPTIAVATDGGTSIIKDDRTVIDITPYTDGYVAFDDAHNLIIGRGDGPIVYGGPIPNADIGETTWRAQSDVTYFGPPTAANIDVYTATYDPGDVSALTKNAFGYDTTLGRMVKFDLNTTDANSTMVAYATTSYNTGWMHGDIKGAFLSDTDTTNVTGSEKIANHDFSADFSTQWEAANNATTSYDATNDRVTVTSTQNYSGIQLKSASLPTLTAGKRYIMTVDIHSITNPIYFGVISGLTVSNVNAAGVWTGVFTASNVTEVFIKKPTGSNSTFVLNSVSIREAEEDRSVNNKGLQVRGTISKQVVATGADLVSYGPFNNNNNLRQPYNSDLNFEQNDFSIMFWVYDTGVDQHCTLISRDEREFDISRLANAYGNKLRIYTRNSSEDLRAPDSASALPQNKWVCVCVVYTGGNTKKVYLDGVLDNTITGTDGEYDIDSTSYGMTIGARTTNGVYNYSATGVQLALIRISGSAPSAEQVKKIYDDEKHLFQENAKCTLYGSSDAVTALAHDDDTDLLHVGTSSGRSDFQGLRRINNTTTAVTTAITAQNEFIIEQ